jgi:ABC-2 type transport system ATP-binding protein
MIRIQNLKKRYGTKEALKGISFEIRRGEVLALLGHNGAGKTTTLRVIATLLDPTEGSIDRPPDFKSVLGFLPDNPFLFEYLTGREMLYFMASLYGIPQAEVQPRARHYLELFELAKQADQLITTYSRGMRRKISLIGSLLHEPVYWLLDEPTESLDPVAIKNLKDLIATRKADNRAILISTHQLALAESVCDRLIILSQGAIVFAGPVSEMEISLEDLYLTVSSKSIADCELKKPKWQSEIRNPQS